MMERAVLENLLVQIKGCTFASMDIETESSPGIRKEETGIRVILFTNQNVNGYENIVKRRLIEAGKDPRGFALGDLPWGKKVPNSPLIEHKDKTYLQYVILAHGLVKCFLTVTGKEVSEGDLNLPSSRTNQGLGPDDEVQIRNVNIANIRRIALMGEQLVSDAPKKAILRISTPEF